MFVQNVFRLGELPVKQLGDLSNFRTPVERQQKQSIAHQPVKLAIHWEMTLACTYTKHYYIKYVYFKNLAVCIPCRSSITSIFTNHH